MLFRPYREKLQNDNDINLETINSEPNYYYDFNNLYKTEVYKMQAILDLSFNDNNKTKNKPKIKLGNKGIKCLGTITFKNLVELLLNNNDISDLTFLENMNLNNLVKFGFSDNIINDISPFNKIKFPKLNFGSMEIILLILIL